MNQVSFFSLIQNQTTLFGKLVTEIGHHSHIAKKCQDFFTWASSFLLADIYVKVSKKKKK